jgi:voltage-gated potassium channel
LIISLLGNATIFYIGDGPLHDDLTFDDAIWYSVISVTTIGYGDFYAQSTLARIGTLVFIVFLGLGSFTFLIGFAIDAIAELALREQRGMSSVVTTNHIVIVNFPSSDRVMKLVEELQADPHHQGREVVVVSDDIDSLPFKLSNVVFVRGPVLSEDTFQRANIAGAALAIVLATDYSDSNSDAVVASAAAVIDRLNTNLHLVAECLDDSHKMLFATVNCDAIVCSLGITGNLLAQEAHDPGISQMIDVITSNIRGTTLFSTPVERGAAAVSYKQLAVELLDRGVNLIAVNRGDDSHTALGELQSQDDDRVIYAAEQRYSWRDLAG